MTQNQNWNQPPNPNQPQAYTPTSGFGPQPSNPYAQQPYAQQPSQQANQYVPQPNPYSMQPEHPDSTAVLILGIASLFIPICGPIAWFMGNKIRKEMAAQPGYYAPGAYAVGWIIGIIVTILTALVILFIVLMFILAIIANAS